MNISGLIRWIGKDTFCRILLGLLMVLNPAVGADLNTAAEANSDLGLIQNRISTRHHWLIDLVLGAAIIIIVLAMILQRNKLRQLVAERTEKLEKSEGRYRLLAEHAVSAIAVFKILRDEAGKPVDFEILDVNPPFEIQASRKGLELFCRIEPSVPLLLRGDPIHLHQVLANFTGNAIKFTGAGKVVIRASCVEETVDDVLLLFSISDTGIGIPEEKLPLLFTMFSQVDASMTRRYGGIGLGLAISKQLVDLMHGQIGVTSREGDGSEFWFCVRLHIQARSAEDESLSPAILKNVKALIVDDSATNREILSTNLTSWEIRTEEAKDREAALKALYSCKNI
jgi:CheY-like chemotaxis protein